MSRSTFLLFKAIISVIFSIALLIAPGPLLLLFGVNLSENGLFIARLFGVDMMGIGFTCWVCRKSDHRLVSDVIFGLFMADAIGLIVMLIGQLQGLMNPLGWVNVIIWLFLTFGLGYFRFVKMAS
ncbi:MAG: hypothetical protein JXA42_20005 [Anaerolineales bacterium]|nr:hypothetical protein [Anaerolineales bacterium]